MAIAKIHAIKTTVNKAIDYIINPEKTVLKDGTQLVSSFGCAVETAHIEFNLSSNLAKEVKGDYTKTGGSDNLAYHLIQSFSVDDSNKITPEKVHELGKQFAEKFLKGKFEYVIATHINTNCIHNHIIFNATSFKNYNKFRSKPYKTVAEIREISDKICEENNLSVIEKKGIGKSYIEWLLNKNGKQSYKDIIKNKIDEIIKSVSSFNDFKNEMLKAGITIKEGKHIAFKLKEQERFIRGKRIGEDYSKEKIEDRIYNKKNKKLLTVTVSKDYIHKVLTDGYILSVPSRDYLLYIKSYDVVEKENNLIISLSDEKYNVLNLNYTPKEKVNADEVFNALNCNELKKEKEEIPISDYLKSRQNQQKELLHKVAQAIHYCNKQGVVYYSDFNLVFADLKKGKDNTHKLLMSLDEKQEEIKKIAKTFVTYYKFLPVHQEYEAIKNTKFKSKKFLNVHHLDLVSFDYAVEKIRGFGIEPSEQGKEDLINLIKTNDKEIKQLEKKAQDIFERIEKLENAKSVIDDFIGNRKQEQAQSLFKHVVKNKDDISL